jgi:hypothetical protein
MVSRNDFGRLEKSAVEKKDAAIMARSAAGQSRHGRKIGHNDKL